jgi:universal stress protein A
LAAAAISDSEGRAMSQQPKRILWPTDFSALSRRGGCYACRLCQHFGAELHVVHVIAPVLTPDFSVLLPVSVPIGGADAELLEVCRKSLAQLVEEVCVGRPGVVCGVLFGNPWSTICDYAKQQEIGLIVVPTHGRTGLGHVVIGSTAERIVQHAPCPVLAVKASGPSFLDE